MRIQALCQRHDVSAVTQLEYTMNEKPLTSKTTLNYT